MDALWETRSIRGEQRDAREKRTVPEPDRIIAGDAGPADLADTAVRATARLRDQCGPPCSVCKISRSSVPCNNSIRFWYRSLFSGISLFSPDRSRFPQCVHASATTPVVPRQLCSVMTKRPCLWSRPRLSTSYSHTCRQPTPLLCATPCRFAGASNSFFFNVLLGPCFFSPKPNRPLSSFVTPVPDTWFGRQSRRGFPYMRYD